MNSAHFLGLLDGPPPVSYVQDSLNDLPSIYPLRVTVALVGAAYRVTFPMEMGDVQPLTMISKAFNQTQTSVEIVRGVSPGPKLALQLDGATTSYLNFRDDNITDAILTEEFQNLFKIRCPPSLNNPQLAPSIVYVEEFESSISSDQTLDVTDVSFCGRGSMRNSTLNLVLETPCPLISCVSLTRSPMEVRSR